MNTGSTNAAGKRDAKLRQACTDFEAVILRKMLGTMRQSVPKSGLVGGGSAEEIYQSMHDDALADRMVRGKGTGLGDLLYRQISGRLQTTSGK